MKGERREKNPQKREKNSGMPGNPLLDISLNFRFLNGSPTARLAYDLGDEGGVRERLARLHDAHDGGLRLELAVGGDALVRVAVLVPRLPQLDLVDLDAVLGVR